ncbi:hypothetical protein Tco_0307281 [Tanacetum coccineum]
MAGHSKKWYNGTSTRTRSTDTSNGLAAIKAQLNKIGREIKKVLIKEIRSLTDAAIQNQRASIKALEIQIGQMSKTKDGIQVGRSMNEDHLPQKEKDPGLGDLSPTKLTVGLADRIIKYPKGVAENVLVGIVVKNMDGYPRSDMENVNFGEPFARHHGVEARRFDILLTINNGNDNVSYQMVAITSKV